MSLRPDLDLSVILNLVRNAPHGFASARYDEEADVLYIDYVEPPVVATDSELGDDDVIVRYRRDEIVGLTVLHASRR